MKLVQENVGHYNQCRVLGCEKRRMVTINSKKSPQSRKRKQGDRLVFCRSEHSHLRKRVSKNIQRTVLGGQFQVQV